MTDNTTFNTVLDVFGWVGLGFTLVGLIVSAFTLTYFMGYKKGGGEWRGTDLFAPKPLVPRPDAEILMEVEILQRTLLGQRNENIRLRKQVEKQYAELHGKEMPAPRKRKPKLTARSIYTP
jgi:hypothetical protein